MIRAVYFDAVGTLIHPQPGAAEVYREVGKCHGGRRHSLATIARRFRKAFAKQEEIDRECGWTTSERRERERWQEIVAEVLDDVADPSACFAELYEHFAKPQAWAVTPGTAELLDNLRRRGYGLGLASNYDHRLHSVVVGLRELKALQRIVVSSDVGWRKPAPAFFAAMCRQANAPPEELLYVGDDRVNDYDGALASGLHSVLVDPRTAIEDLAMGSRRIDAIRTLEDLIAVLDCHGACPGSANRG